MTYKTHVAVGVGTSTMLFLNNDIKTIIVGTTLAVVGSLIVDIDTPQSKAASYFRNIVYFGVILIILNTILTIKLNINILNYILQDQVQKTLVPVLLLLIFIFLGKISKHRSFTHSVLGLIAFTVPIYMLVGQLYTWFAIGYTTHILADMLNEKEVKVLFPLKKGICIGACKSDGIVDKLLCISFIIITIMKYKSYLNIL